MRTLVLTAALAALTVLAPARALSQTDTTLHVSQLMSPAERDSTGISTLTPAQRAALDAWLTRYTATTARIVQRAAPQEIVIRHASVRNGFRVVQILNDGASVVLDDGTVWEVNVRDRPTVDAWRIGDFVLVRRLAIELNDVAREFSFALINGRVPFNSSIAARLVGREPGGQP